MIRSIFLFLLVGNAAAGQLAAVMLPGLDGKPRALGVFVPTSYDSKHPAPLFLWLHGGTNGTEPNRGAGAVSFFADQAEKAGILCAAPSAERGATWFDPVGYGAIVNSLEYMKTHYSVDQNRIFAGGSSDGATACYILAMRNTVPKARGFVVCSGYPYLLDRLGIGFDPRQCAKYPWYIVHTGKDHLFPLVDVERAVSAIVAAGGNVVFHKYPGLPHGLEYADKEKPQVLKWMQRRVSAP